MMATKAQARCRAKPLVWKQPEMFAVKDEPRAQRDQWRLESPPPSLGTLPREVYQAWCVLRDKGPMTGQQLNDAVRRCYDWDVMRIMRVVQKLASSGYVTLGEGGVLTARTEAP